MRKTILIQAALLVVAVVVAAAQPAGEFQTSFQVDKKTLGVKGSNAYFNLTPGYTLSYRHGRDTGILTILNETKWIDGVETRVLEDREIKNGKLVELTRDYFAIDSITNDVYYFGEDVDVYKDGKITGHGGSWLSGLKGAQFGLMIPGTPRAGQRFFQERAPGVGMDRVEIVSVDERVVTPAGTFEHCVHAVETSELEPGLKDHKWYAAGIGQVKDEAMVLVNYTGK